MSPGSLPSGCTDGGFLNDDPESERRLNERHQLQWGDLKILVAGVPFGFRLKDFSCSGACGLTDAPLAVNQTVFFLLPQTEPVAAQVRWIRRTLIGAAFEEPLSTDRMRMIRTSCRAYMRKMRSSY